MRNLFTVCLLLSFYAPAGYSFFGSVAEDIPLYGESDPNQVTGSDLAVVSDTDYEAKPTQRLETVSCEKLTSNNVPLKMINALRYSSRDKMKVNLKYDQNSGSYKVNVEFPNMVTNCFKPGVNIKRYAGNFVVEVKNHYFDGKVGDNRPMMEKYESCLKTEGVLGSTGIDRKKAKFGTFAVSEHEVALSDIFDGKSKIDHIEALFASPKETPREFLTAFSNMAPDQPNNCFNMEYFGGMKKDLLSKKQLAEHRFEWICDGNGNVLDVDELLTTMPKTVGNYTSMIKDLTQIKASMQETKRSDEASELRKKLEEAVKKMKKLKSGDRYEYEMAVSEYFTILTALEEKDIKPMMDELITLRAKVTKSKGPEHAKQLKRLKEVEAELRFYNRLITFDNANKLAKDGFYDEAKLTYMMKTLLDKRTNAGKKVAVGKNKKGKKRYVMLDSYEDFYDYAELVFEKKSRVKYKDLQKVFQVKEEGASYSEESYDKAKEIAASADKRYNSFVEKMQKSCERNFFGFMKDKDKCEKYQKQWKKEAARRETGYKYAGKHLGDAKKFSAIEGERGDDLDDEFDEDYFDPETFYQANALGSFQRYGTPQYGQQANPFGTQQFGQTQQFGMPQQFGMQPQYFGQQQQFGMQPQYFGQQQQFGTQFGTQFGQPQQFGMPQQFGTQPTQFGQPQQSTIFR